MAIITISRQYGSGGDEIATQICKVLQQYHQFGKGLVGLMAQVADEMGIQEHEIVDFSEDTYKARSFFERLFNTQHTVSEVKTWTEETSGALTPEVKKLSEEQSVMMVRDVIEAAYKHDNLVAIGRGGQAILKGKPGVLHVRIVAPLDERIQRIQDRENVSQKDAQKIIVSHDRATADYLKRFYDVDVADAMLYHLVINTGKWDIEAAAQVIIAAVKSLPPEESSD